MTISRICVFDFDGTLFRSPEKPDWWPHQGFWGRLETLSPPLVPEDPGPEWYVAEALDAALQAPYLPWQVTALVTGRVQKFEPRIKALLANAFVHLNEYHFAKGGDTLSFKVGVIQDLMRRHPDASEVDIWDDREEHLPVFREAVEKEGRVALIRHVRSGPMEFLRSA